MEPKCATCNKLGASGLDEKQFDVTKKVLRSGLTKNFIRCKNGKNVLPSNRNFEYVEVSENFNRLIDNNRTWTAHFGLERTNPSLIHFQNDEIRGVQPPCLILRQKFTPPLMIF